MRIVYKNQKFGVTLIELLIAVILLSAVVLTGVSVELAMRQMQTKPTAKVKLLDELMPVVDKIKKDFDRQIGNLDSASVIILSSGRSLQILVDDGPSSLGKIDSDDTWYEYRWSGTQGDPVQYYISGAFTTNIAYNITNFVVSTPPGANINEALTIFIGKKMIPGQAEDPITNPGINITTTVYARGVSLN